MVFEKLRDIYEIEVEYIAKSSLAILAGRESAFAAIDQVVTMVGGVPVIPGSSIKGALRSGLEAILSQRGMRICVPLSAIPQEYGRGVESYAESIGRIPPCSPRKKECCPICQIFGAADLSARAIILDAKPIGEPLLNDRTHVAITRDNKAAAGGKLQQLQVIDAGAKFKGVIRLINPEPWQIGAIITAINSLPLLGLGAKKSAGYGEIEANITQISKRELKNSTWSSEPIEQLHEFLVSFKVFGG